MHTQRVGLFYPFFRHNWTLQCAPKGLEGSLHQYYTYASHGNKHSNLYVFCSAHERPFRGRDTQKCGLWCSSLAPMVAHG